MNQGAPAPDAVGPPSASSLQAHKRLAWHLRIIATVSVLVCAPLFCYFTTVGSWNLARENTGGAYSSRFFFAQAESMLHGYLEVEPTDILSECFVRDGRCYGYFGVTPSLLRMPMMGFLRLHNSGMASTYIAAGLLLALWAALSLVRRSLLDYGAPGDARPLARTYLIFAALALGPGSTLVFLTRPGVYEEAAAWGLAFGCLMVDRVWAWQKSRSPWTLFFAVCFGWLAANGRPTVAPAAVVLGVVVALLHVMGRDRVSNLAAAVGAVVRKPRLAGSTLLLAACLSLLPGLGVAGIFWLKFRTPMPDMRMNDQIAHAQHWIDILKRNGDRTTGFIFTQTALTMYFRPDAVIFHPTWPWVGFRFPDAKPIQWVPPLPRNGAYVEHTTSVTATMPLPWLMNAVVAGWLLVAAWPVWRRYRRREPAGDGLSAEEWALFTGSLLAAMAMTVLTITTVGITNRYLADFYLISVVGFACGQRLLLPSLARYRLDRYFAWVFGAVLVTWSIIATFSLTTFLVLM